MGSNYRVYKERSSGHYKYFRQGTFHLARPNNSWVTPSGEVKTAREWLPSAFTRRASPPRRAPPTSPNVRGYTKMGFKAMNASRSTYHRMYESNSNGLFRYYRDGVFYLVRPDSMLLSNSGSIKTAREWFPRVFVRRAPPPPPPPRRAPSPPRSAVVNYNNILKRNTSRLNMAKISRYARVWLGKNVPANASYKRAALIIHPDKGNRTNATNQLKRVALFKLLGGLK